MIVSKDKQNGGSKPPPYVVLIFFSAFIFIVFVIAFGDGKRTLFLSPPVGVGAFDDPY